MNPVLAFILTYFSTKLLDVLQEQKDNRKKYGDLYKQNYCLKVKENLTLNVYAHSARESKCNSAKLLDTLETA